MLFLPRGYVTFLALFWAYQNGSLDSLLNSTDPPTATQIAQWLRPTESNSEFASPVSKTDRTSLKSQILEELSNVDPVPVSDESAANTTTRIETSGEMRSEIPLDFRGYLHRIFR